jgi:hypothetical protein
MSCNYLTISADKRAMIEKLHSILTTLNTHIRENPITGKFIFGILLLVIIWLKISHFNDDTMDTRINGQLPKCQLAPESTQI